MDIDGEAGHVKTGTDWSYTATSQGIPRDCWQPPDATEARKDSSLEPLEGT